MFEYIEYFGNYSC